ncbi:MAG: molybdenum cofactor guanylyltransferase MobA [Rhodoferax sp.]|nr:molybdenum cofactor guanylyltransferase MobA [Rhodoferax sp.]
MEITGLILAGGRGTRMGNRDKGLIPFDGQPLVSHVVRRLQPQVQHLLINANQNLQTYSAFGLPLCSDVSADFAGPLAGLQAGLMRCKTSHLMAVPCDAPLLPLDLVSRLLQGLQTDGADAAFAVTHEGEVVQPHPVFCLLRVHVLDQLNQFLESGGRSMLRWFATLRVAQVPFSDTMAFCNLNTLEELRRHEHRSICEQVALAPATGGSEKLP